MSDLSEGTEALKRNFLFRGFFRDRGFFDLDAITREAYVAGALERGDRTALRIWIDAAGLFERTADGTELLTEAGRRRLESAMADLVRYPRDSPMVVEGYADSTAGEAAYLISSDRALLVREYLLSRFRRRVTLTGIMPMSERAIGSPRGGSLVRSGVGPVRAQRRPEGPEPAVMINSAAACPRRRTRGGDRDAR